MCNLVHKLHTISHSENVFRANELSVDDNLKQFLRLSIRCCWFTQHFILSQGVISLNKSVLYQVCLYRCKGDLRLRVMVLHWFHNSILNLVMYATLRTRKGVVVCHLEEDGHLSYVIVYSLAIK